MLAEVLRLPDKEAVGACVRQLSVIAGQLAVPGFAAFAHGEVGDSMELRSPMLASSVEA